MTTPIMDVQSRDRWRIGALAWILAGLLAIGGCVAWQQGGDDVPLAPLEFSSDDFSDDFEESQTSSPDATVAAEVDGDVIDPQVVGNSDSEQAFEDALNALVTADPIVFASGSAELSPESVDTLDRIVALFFENTGIPVLIEGHTDNTGSRDGNVALSQARADAVEQYLIDRDVDVDRLSTQGFGPDEPKADNSTAEGQAQNRRIEFTVNP